AAATPAARVTGLVKTFGARKALAGITAELPTGRILGLVGPDGAGKTTLIRLLAGLMEPTAGAVEVLGRTPRAEGGTRQAETGYMPQRFGLYEDLSVLDNLSLYANLRALDQSTRQRRFAHIWLLDKGRLLYDGAPARLSERVRGRVFRRRVAPGEARRVAESELEREAVLDAVIQGASVRVVAKPDAAGSFRTDGYEPV